MFSNSLSAVNAGPWNQSTAAGAGSPMTGQYTPYPGVIGGTAQVGAPFPMPTPIYRVNIPASVLNLPGAIGGKLELMGAHIFVSPGIFHVAYQKDSISYETQVPFDAPVKMWEEHLTYVVDKVNKTLEMVRSQNNAE